jgi:Clp amino terminal domain, pathogenicity island component
VNDSDRHPRFTARARKVLSLAQEEAQRFNYSYVETEHLLLGLVRVDDGVAAKVLSDLGVDLNAVRVQVESIIGRGDRVVLDNSGLTPRAKKVVELAVDEARRLNHQYIGTEHLLLGLVREGEGIAAKVLESLGLYLENVRTQTIQVLSHTSQATQATGGVASETEGAATAQQRPLGSHVSSTMHRQTHPVFRDLLRVIPISEHQEHAGVAVTAVALEVYADGSLLTLLLQRARAEPDPRFQFARLGGITVTITDDHDNVYAGWLHGSSGSYGSGMWEERAQCACTPTLDPAAGALRIEIAAIQWTYAEETAQGERRWVPGEVAPGPWIFSIRLPAVGP